jgi:hypothetical protein
MIVRLRVVERGELVVVEPQSVETAAGSATGVAGR